MLLVESLATFVNWDALEIVRCRMYRAWVVKILLRLSNAQIDLSISKFVVNLMTAKGREPSFEDSVSQKST